LVTLLKASVEAVANKSTRYISSERI
jgi:hypothetical protein